MAVISLAFRAMVVRSTVEEGTTMEAEICFDPPECRGGVTAALRRTGPDGRAAIVRKVAFSPVGEAAGDTIHSIVALASGDGCTLGAERILRDGSRLPLGVVFGPRGFALAARRAGPPAASVDLSVPSILPCGSMSWVSARVYGENGDPPAGDPARMEDWQELVRYLGRHGVRLVHGYPHGVPPSPGTRDAGHAHGGH